MVKNREIHQAVGHHRMNLCDFFRLVKYCSIQPVALVYCNLGVWKLWLVDWPLGPGPFFGSVLPYFSPTPNTRDIHLWYNQEATGFDTHHMTIVLIIKGFVFEGPTLKTKDIWVPGIYRRCCWFEPDTLYSHIFHSSTPRSSSTHPPHTHTFSLSQTTTTHQNKGGLTETKTFI